MRGVLTAGLILLAVFIAAPSAQAVAPTPVQCNDLSTAMNDATAGEVLQLPPGTCQANVTVTSNTTSFTLEGATSGAKTVLEPASGSTSTPIIQSPADVHFTLTGLTFKGDTSSALLLDGTDEAVTVTHDVFTANQFPDGTGAAIDVFETGTAKETTVISDTTFSHDSSGEGGAVWWDSDQPLVVEHNTFTADSATDGADGGGGLLVWNEQGTGAETSVQISDNVFGGPTAADGDTSQSSGGGAFLVLDPTQTLTVTGNTFEHDRIAGTDSSPYWRVGGGLFVDLTHAGTPYPMTQSHNLFKENTIAESGASETSTGGGGEWIIGLTVTSTADSFIDNRIAVSNGTYPAEGGGVGAIASQAESPAPAEPAAFNGRDDLFSGNSVAAGGWGGGIYVGIPDASCTSTCPGSGLNLYDSTVVNNTVDAGTGSEGGAVWGSPNDTLGIYNSIVYGNTPRPEIFGFSSTTPAFYFSDVCTEPGGPPHVQNVASICANPLLAAGGTETIKSPTIDVGSNPLVPKGLTTDLAGHPRILDSRQTCAGPGPATVDMGAFEATFKLRPKCSAKVTVGTGTVRDQNGKTKVSLACPGGYLYCQGTVTLITDATGKKLTLGHSTFKVGDGDTSSITVTLSKDALHKLGHRRSVKVSINAKDHDAQGDRATSHGHVTLELPKSS